MPLSDAATDPRGNIEAARDLQRQHRAALGMAPKSDADYPSMLAEYWAVAAEWKLSRRPRGRRRRL